MVITMGVVLVVVAFIAMFGGGVIFAPATTAVSGAVPTADVTGGFAHAKRTMPFPVTVPADVPESWQPNSQTVSTPQVDGKDTQPTVRGGWVTGNGTFITLIESSGTPDQVLTAEIGSAGPSRGTRQAGGATWTVTDGVRQETAWIRSTGETTFLITGNAPAKDFVTLAEAVAPAD
jgi:hypothetical protein